MNKSHGALINRECSLGAWIIEASERLDSFERHAVQRKVANAKATIEKMRAELCSMLVEHASLRTELGRSDSGLSDEYLAIRRKHLIMQENTDKPVKEVVKELEKLVTPYPWDLAKKAHKRKEDPNEVFAKDLREYLDRVYPSTIPPLVDVLDDAVNILASVGISLKKIEGDSAEFVDANGVSRVTVIAYNDILKDELYAQLLFFVTRLGTADKLIANFGAPQEVSEKRSRIIYQGWTHIRWARAFGRVK